MGQRFQQKKFAVVVCLCCVLFIIFHFSDPTVLEMFSTRIRSVPRGREFDVVPHPRGQLNARLNDKSTSQYLPTNKQRGVVKPQQGNLALATSKLDTTEVFTSKLFSTKLVTPEPVTSELVTSELVTKEALRTKSITSERFPQIKSSKTNTSKRPETKPATQSTARTTSDTTIAPVYGIEPTESPSQVVGNNKDIVCKLPKLDPWDRSISHLLNEEGVDPGCSTRYPLPPFDVINNSLVPKPGVSLDEFNSVSVTTIERPVHDDWQVNHGEVIRPFVGATRTIKSDFFRVNYVKNNQHLSHLYARVVPKKHIKDKFVATKKTRKDSKNIRDLNVLILGFDSTSFANFLRKMKHSLDFLVKGDLHTHFLKGYTVVGDATTPNMCALLTGKDETELPEARRSYFGAQPIDSWPWLAKEFKSKGYATLFAEDDPTMGMFNLRLLGLQNPDGIYDHYMRPFWLELENAGERDEPGVCSKSTSMANFTLDYLASYFDAYSDMPKFGFAFMGFSTHARPNYMSFLDYDLLHFLKFFKKNNFHENTMLVILGDHGSRNDDVRNTMQGKLEERLPWLSITLPKWVEEKYPDIRAALRHNQNLISTPFDMHTTLRHVLNYPDLPSGEKGQSLFTKLPRNRTCQDAYVDEHWCPCLQFQTVNVNNSKIILAAESVVKKINGFTSSNPTLKRNCKRLILKKIHSAVRYEANTKLQEFSSTNQDTDRKVNFGYRTPDNLHYQITLETAPGRGMFEATVTIVSNETVVNPYISRTNVYGDQPSCIANIYPYARKYCVCRKKPR